MIMLLLQEIIENYTEYDLDEQDVITFLTELKHQEIMPILKKIIEHYLFSSFTFS